MNSKEEYIPFLVDMIEDAGAFAMKHFRQKLDINNKSDGEEKFDPVTQADREVEEFIRERISEIYPGHNIIGEEFGHKDTGNSETWLIDPIDGTRGYVSGSPMWGILIGLMNNDDCVVGAMRQPFTRETWVGDNETAWHIDERGKREISVGSTSEISNSIVCCTHPAMYPTEESLQQFYKVLGACRFSRYGTECLAYGMLASGFVDVVVEGGLSAYDIMPLIPIVKGAGGIITNWEGGSVAQGGFAVAAANETLHQQALELLHS